MHPLCSIQNLENVIAQNVCQFSRTRSHTTANTSPGIQFKFPLPYDPNFHKTFGYSACHFLFLSFFFAHCSYFHFLSFPFLSFPFLASWCKSAGKISWSLIHLLFAVNVSVISFPRGAMTFG